MPQNSPQADSDGLVHGLLNVHDLLERRVDLWINNFPGATHLLDVYSNRRVDKRRAFPSQYTRLQHLQELHHSTPTGYTVRIAHFCLFPLLMWAVVLYFCFVVRQTRSDMLWLVFCLYSDLTNV